MEESAADRRAGTELSVDQHAVDDALVIRVAGEIDLHTGPQLQEAVGDGLRRPAGSRVVLDLTDVTFLGSMGLAVLAEARQQADTHRVELRIVVGSNRAVRRPLEATGLDSVLTLYERVSDALRA